MLRIKVRIVVRSLGLRDEGQLPVRQVLRSQNLTIVAFEAVIFCRRQNDEVVLAALGDRDRLNASAGC